LNPDSDVSILQIGDNPTRLIALQARSIDGAIFDPPEYKKAVEAGGRVLFSLEETMIPYQHAGLVSTRKFLGARADVARRVVRSIVEGAAVLRKDDRELEETYQLLRRFTRPKPYPSREGFQAILNDLTKRMPAAKNADARDFFDARWIEELDRSGAIDGL
jgi:ABC-type nitrate/sulfonate/bicarbonate transport system substrate-binding protein